MLDFLEKNNPFYYYFWDCSSIPEYNLNDAMLVPENAFWYVADRLKPPLKSQY